MPSASNFKGGAVELLFCNVGLNFCEDNNSVYYYAYQSKELNVGSLGIKGSFIVEDYEIVDFKEPDNYNYITTKDLALRIGVKDESVISNIKTNVMVRLDVTNPKT